MKEALETIKLLRNSLDTHGMTRYDYREYWSDQFEKVIAKLEANQQRECCLICKNRLNCKLADSIYEMHGMKSIEMWFSCFQPKEEK